jgi:hypothetical protein
MKIKCLFLLAIALLLQSCYSYRTIDLNNAKLIDGKSYKILQDDKLVKVRLKNVNEGVATVNIKNTEKQIPLSDIKIIQARKFSVLKTIGLGVAVFMVVVIGAYAADPEINVGDSN